jgi:MFS family permease
MKDKYIELRINRDFGDILTAYFDFLKQNIKKFTNVFLSYNGIFLIGLLITSYLLVSGFVGMISTNSALYGIDAGQTDDETYWIYIIAGGILFFLIFLMVAGLNFSLSSSYMIKYDEHKGISFTKTEVWNLTKEKLGNTVVFILLLIPIYLLFFIASIIFAFIPLLGMFAQYIIQFFMTAWIGVSFYSMLSENKGVTDAFGEGWNLVSKNFWKSVGVNFILGLLNGLLMFIVLIIPGILIGIYTFHVVENNVDVGGIVSTVVYTLGLCALLVLMVYAQCLSQFINGILFYTLHEKTYNVNTRSKIEQIGQSEQ